MPTAVTAWATSHMPRMKLICFVPDMWLFSPDMPCCCPMRTQPTCVPIIPAIVPPGCMSPAH
eukprot:2357160-Ditylum_brightwellii.AAC.1